MTARPIRRNAQTPDRNGKIFYTSTTSLSHISKVIALIIARFSAAKFLEASEETFYCVPAFIHLFIKRPRLLCVHFRRERIAGGLVMQIGPDLFCAIGFIGKNITVLQIRKPLQQGGLPPCSHQHFRQTAKKPQAAGLFRQLYGFSCSTLRVFCRCCLMSEFCSLSYTTACLHGCFDRR